MSPGSKRDGCCIPVLWNAPSERVTQTLTQSVRASELHFSESRYFPASRYNYQYLCRDPSSEQHSIYEFGLFLRAVFLIWEKLKNIPQLLIFNGAARSRWRRRPGCSKLSKRHFQQQSSPIFSFNRSLNCAVLVHQPQTLIWHCYVVQMQQSHLRAWN